MARLYDWMVRGVGASSAFDPLRDIFREHILATWPLGEGDLALDYRLPARRLHSIRTASQVHDLHPKRLRKLLVESSIIAETDTPNCDVLFSAPEASNLLEQASGSVSFTSAQRRLGMTRTQMERLIAEGILEPGEGGGTARPRFIEASIQEGIVFFEAFPEAPRYHTLLSISEIVSSPGEVVLLFRTGLRLS